MWRLGILFGEYSDDTLLPESCLGLFEILDLVWTGISYSSGMAVFLTTEGSKIFWNSKKESFPLLSRSII